MKIGIIGKSDNSEVKLLKHRVEEQSQEVIIIDLTNFPQDPAPKISKSNIYLGNINLNEIDALYVNSLCTRGFPFPHIPKDKWEEHYKIYKNYVSIEKENTSFKHSILNWLIMQGKLVINPPYTYEYHAMKIYEYYRLKNERFDIPDTISSNDPDALKRFIKKQGGTVLYKANVGGYLHTTLIDENMIEEIKESLCVRPIVLQQFIKGYNIRCFVLANEFLGAVKVLQTDEFVDSRVVPKGVQVIELPEDIKKIAIKATKFQGFIFSGIDFMYSEEDNKYYLLECNSSPMFRNFETMSGLNISQKLVNYLINLA